MTPAEKNVLKSLVAVAWADGQLANAELGVIAGLLAGFDASEEEEAEILEYAATPRTLLGDIPVELLSIEDRELLLSNAALLTQADGTETESERNVLRELAHLLGFDFDQAREIIGTPPSGENPSRDAGPPRVGSRR